MWERGGRWGKIPLGGAMTLGTRIVLTGLLMVTLTASVGVSSRVFGTPVPGVSPEAIADEMVAVPAGSFVMGSPGKEAHRQQDEGPLHTVHVGRFAIAKYPVTRAQWAAFTTATHRPPPSADCYQWSESQWVQQGSYLAPGFPQSDSDPVVCVSWEDAHDYVRWLSATTGKRYRLPSEAEWEYVARAGSNSAYYWGDSFDPDRVANNHRRTEPVGAHAPNAFGVYDTLGNAWEWVADCYHDSYLNSPTDGSAWATGQCTEHVFRGGSWHNTPQVLRVANRGWDGSSYRFFDLGFTIAMDI
jgi:formylglycine-generating enzyme required for sulfatase activity